jgi:peptidoglycan/LPS O-acetylase OafA/YrhL
MSTEVRGQDRIAGVDLLRGLAILFVILNHVNIRLRIARVPFADGVPDQLMSLLVWNGQRAVQMFFAISGFLITSTSLRRWNFPSLVSIVDFYKLRFARIAPLMVALLTVLTALHFIGVKYYVVQPRTGGISQALLAALTFRINVLEATRGYLPGNWDILWSLSVEEVFYLCFPLACRFFGTSRALTASLCVLVILGPFARTVFSRGNEVWYEHSYLGGMDAIALGCLTALFLKRVPLPAKWPIWVGLAGALALVFSFCFLQQAESWGLRKTGLDMTVVTLGACLVSAASSESGWRAPGLLQPLLNLGQRSYEVYLTHVFVIFVFLAAFLSLNKPIALVPAYFFASILVSGLLGEVVARLYSEPMNRWLRSGPLRPRLNSTQVQPSIARRAFSHKAGL